MSDILAMQRAVWTSARSANEKLVLLAIIDYFSACSQEPWPSVATLCKRSSLGRTTVIEALAALERDGVISVRRDHGRSNHYDLSRVCETLAPVRDADLSAARSGIARPTLVGDPQAVRAANRSAERSSPHGELDPSARRTGPVREADPKEPKKEPKKEPTATPTDDAQPSLALRAKVVLERLEEAHRQRPQEWAEVQLIAEAFGRSIGHPRKLGDIEHDAGLRAIVSLLAAGHAPDDIAWVAEHVPRQRWWRDGTRTRGLSTLSAEVVARALEERRCGIKSRPTCAEELKNSEERRLRRNALLSNAECGRYGKEIQRRARSGQQLKTLADELEGLDRTGRLHGISPRTASAPRTHSIGTQVSRLASPAPVKCAPREPIREGRSESCGR